LIRRSEAVAVISSTVGLEALLYEKPVLTIGQPFYSGFGVTLDVDSFRELRTAVPALLRFRPDPERIRRFLHAAMRACYPGAPVLVDRSQENAVALADSIEQRALDAVAERVSVHV
jgi:capsule polysaccharide export protein KpsC/LpsZ